MFCLEQVWSRDLTETPLAFGQMHRHQVQVLGDLLLAHRVDQLVGKGRVGFEFIKVAVHASFAFGVRRYPQAV